MFSMRYVGDDRGPAPRLSDSHLEDPQPLLHEVLRGVEELARAGVVHADLSAHNILVYEDRPWFIDFSEAIRVDRTGDVPWMRLEEARVALERGFCALSKYFGKYGLDIDQEQLISRIIKSLDRFGVLERG